MFTSQLDMGVELLWLLTIKLYGRKLIIECKEILQWLVNLNLLVSLQGSGILVVEYLHVVLGINPEASAIGVSIIQWLSYTLCIILCHSPILHKFD
jgi:hypothetical protein